MDKKKNHEEKSVTPIDSMFLLSPTAQLEIFNISRLQGSRRKVEWDKRKQYKKESGKSLHDNSLG